eukprot:373630_1
MATAFSNHNIDKLLSFVGSTHPFIRNITTAACAASRNYDYNDECGDSLIIYNYIHLNNKKSTSLSCYNLHHYNCKELHNSHSEFEKATSVIQRPIQKCQMC